MLLSKQLYFCFAVLLLAACGGTSGDLLPSGSDKRPPVESGTSGPAVGQNAPDFTVLDSLGNQVVLSEITGTARGVVLYFTMWCPTCYEHMSHVRDSVIPLYPGVTFYAVDYVSGTISEARNAQVANGFSGPGFIVLADTAHTIQEKYLGTMARTVVIDRHGIIRMNEDFKTGATLLSCLSALP